MLASLAPSACLALFNGCDYSIDLQIGYTQEIQSFGYPKYGSPVNTSCRYVVKAPGEYQVQATCYIDFVGKQGECKKELFFVGLDGNPDINYAEPKCGTSQNVWTSTYNSMTLGMFFETF